jgi:hypothetical protein
MGQLVGLMVSEAAKEAAERLGHLREVEVPAADGKTKIELQEGEDGMVGYMMFLGKVPPSVLCLRGNQAAFRALIRFASSGVRLRRAILRS